MRKVLGLGLMLGALSLFACLRASAQDIMDCYWDGSSEQGGNRITVNGIQSNQYVQQSYPGATVTVYIHNTSTLATIYTSGTGSTPLANPFISSNHSVAYWCAADGHYDVKYSGLGITNPYTINGIHICFSCNGGGGGGIGPGTVNQVAKFVTTTNVGDSSGGPDDGTNPVPWTNGLSVNDSGYNKRRPNGANCTIASELVMYDGSVVGGLSSVQTATIGTNNAIGVAGQGAGCSGNVQIVDHAFHSCIFDNQTVIGDAVIASATTAGYCSDGGGTVSSHQVVGRVASLNSGTGTSAVVDWFTGDTTQAAGAISPCATVGSNAFYQNTGSFINCDPQVIDDAAGHMTMLGAGFVDTANSGWWYATQGTLLPQSSMQPNSIYFGGGSTITAYGFQLQGTIPTSGNCMQWGPGDIAGYIKLTDSGSPCGTGSGVTLKTNTVNNTSQATLDNTNGLGITVANPSGGVVTYSITGATQVATPTAPTLVVNGSTGATTITYKVVASEDPYGVYRTLASSTTSVTNANATLSSSNSVTLSAYGDTLYGARCFDIYRTAAGGTPSTTGKIASCVGKKFTDTGLAGDSTSSPTTNNTILVPHYGALPVANIPPNGVTGVDAPPAAPTAFDDENGQTYGAPADVNNTFWTWCNQQTASAAWSNGAIVLTTDTGTQYENVCYSLPGSTPYTFTVYVDTEGLATGAGCGIGFRESGTGKIAFLELVQNNGADSTAASGGMMLQIVHGTTYSTGLTGVHFWAYRGTGAYLRIQNTGTNIVYSYSNTDNGIAYQQLFSEAQTTPFTTTPNQLLVGGRSSTTAGVCTFDYTRRTQ